MAASDAAAKMASSSDSSSAAPATTAADAAAAGGGPTSLTAELKARHASLRAARNAAPDANEVLDAVANAMDAAAAAAGAR